MTEFQVGDLVKLVRHGCYAAQKGARGVVSPRGIFKTDWADTPYVDIVWDRTDPLVNNQQDGGYGLDDVEKVNAVEWFRAPGEQEVQEAEVDEEFVVADEANIYGVHETYEEALKDARHSVRNGMGAAEREGEDTLYIYKRVATVSGEVKIEVLEG